MSLSLAQPDSDTCHFLLQQLFTTSDKTCLTIRKMWMSIAASATASDFVTIPHPHGKSMTRKPGISWQKSRVADENF